MRLQASGPKFEDLGLRSERLAEAVSNYLAARKEYVEARYTDRPKYDEVAFALHQRRLSLTHDTYTHAKSFLHRADHEYRRALAGVRVLL